MSVFDRKETAARPLKLRSDGGFRILEIHGTEICEANIGTIPGQIGRLLDSVKPDLVYLTGDMTAGASNVSELEKRLDALIGPIEERNLEWTHIFGDMDRRAGLAAEDQLASYKKYPHCHSIAGPSELDGCGNYILPVLDSRGDPAFVLWGFDTGCEIGVYEEKYHSPHRARLASPIYTEHYMDGIHMNQTMWYWHLSQELEADYGRKIPGLMFFHTSTQEHTIIPMNERLTGMRGSQDGQVVCSVVCGGMWSAVFERKDVQGIYCGHTRRDKNNFVGSYGGIRLGLSPAFKDGEQYYRVFEFRDGIFSEMF